MRIYAAVSGVADLPSDWPNVLVSFALDPGLRSAVKARDVLVDSGAFTAWRAGKHIDLGDYIAWCRDHRGDRRLSFINLDVIPGQIGRAPTRAEAARAMAASERNADALRAAGLSIMEVWHRGEDLAQLHRLIERRRPGERVGIGGLVGVRPGDLRRTVDAVFAEVRDRYGWDALPPLHGLGVGAESHMRRYPWWSCDSTTFSVPRRYGKRLQRVSGSQADITDRRGPYQELEVTRILRRWRRVEGEITRQWQARGIQFDTPPEAP